MEACRRGGRSNHRAEVNANKFPKIGACLTSILYSCVWVRAQSVRLLYFQTVLGGLPRFSPRQVSAALRTVTQLWSVNSYASIKVSPSLAAMTATAAGPDSVLAFSNGTTGRFYGWLGSVMMCVVYRGPKLNTSVSVVRSQCGERIG